MSFLINIDSKNRDYKNEPICDFSTNVNDLFGNREKDISLASITIPRSYYVINNNNNTFNIKSTDLGITGGTNVSLTNGNYTNTTFCSELTTQLNNLSLGATFVSSISTNTQKLSITSSTGDFTITSNTQNNRYLGLDINTSKNSTSSVYTSNNVIDLSGTSYIDLIVDLPLASINNTNQNKNILARIWPNVDYFDTIFYSTQNFDYVKLLTLSIGSIRTTLRDEW